MRGMGLGLAMAAMVAAVAGASTLKVILPDGRTYEFEIPGPPVSRFQCDAPKGMRVDIGPDQPGSTSPNAEWAEDGFAGVRPTVTIEPAHLVVHWGNAVPPALIGKVDNSTPPERIRIEGTDGGSVWGASSRRRTAELFRFYTDPPTLIRYTSGHGLLAGGPMAAVYVAPCRPQ